MLLQKLSGLLFWPTLYVEVCVCNVENVEMLQNSELTVMLLDRWLDVLDNVVHAVGKKLSALALVSMLTSNVQYVVTLFL